MIERYNLSGDNSLSGIGDKPGTNPWFVNAAGADFRLQTDGPAVNAGTSTAPVVTTDLRGEPRPQGGAYDLGAYEMP